MTAPTPLRHALVVAPQCPKLGLLDDLESVALSLRDLLTDHWRGACSRSTGAETSLLHGVSVSQARIEAAVRTAARHAAREQAVLVVAFLGHGITPGQNPTLYLMAGDSQPDEIATAVNVGALLTQALETPGLPGVIALVDTCHAGGATPDLQALDAGVRQGATRLSLLMGVGAAQPAYRLSFSRGVTEVLRRGIRGGGEFLYPTAVLGAVRAAVPGQDARLVEYDGAQFGDRPWLARNGRHPFHTTPLLGPVASEELELALAPLGCSALVSAPLTDAQALERLRDALPEQSTGSAAELAWALRVVGGMVDGVRTVELLTTSWPGRRPTSQRLRRALSSASERVTARPPETSGRELLRDAVEFLRLRAPRLHEARTAPLATFVAALAVDDALPEDHGELVSWAHAVGCEVELSDAFESLREHGSRTRLRLIVSLHAAVAGEWPESLDAWLLDGGEVHAHREFTCAPDQIGVEQQLATVLRWASARARIIGARLRRVEIAASAALLLRWRPEETDFGELLGVAYDVVLRWSERLCPPDHLWWINERARTKLAAMTASATGTAPVDWLGEPETGEAHELRKLLRNDTYRRAVALEHRPPRFEQVMEVLLAYAPIVLWPCADDCAPERFRETLDRYWHLLPAEFCEAYRHSWGQRVPGKPDGREQLARWRTVWHDIEWLDFCDRFEQFTTEEENSA
ncbi:hypothetical protein [Streptomyces sp. MB09-02B]|uniref:vWA-MoxR associated conflict system protein n=1 Tax=Streptomyces sp. MB09-02B TaxID=3028667 RepID=UPI0029BEC72B|nr:hypothetical protein [Streptomyces sp. MB09-02B]MDX3640647.1 hypothetical protein [Streptomyces sp. MB09-02B]